MGVIRQVSKNSATGMYCYIEFSDELESVFTILGGQYFATKPEAEEYSLGFESDSYVFENPEVIQTRLLLEEKTKLENRIQEIQQLLPPE